MLVSTSERERGQEGGGQERESDREKEYEYAPFTQPCMRESYKRTFLSEEKRRSVIEHNLVSKSWL